MAKLDKDAVEREADRLLDKHFGIGPRRQHAKAAVLEALARQAPEQVSDDARRPNPVGPNLRFTPPTPNKAGQPLDMCAHGADRGSYCGYCGGYSAGGTAR
jgi:hypothetical protein